MTSTSTLPSTTTELCVPKDGFSPEMVDSIGWLPLVSLIVYKFFFSIGYGPLPWMMNGEFFPLEAKGCWGGKKHKIKFCYFLLKFLAGTASSISTAFNWTCAFLVTKYEVKLEDAIGTYGAYFLFSGLYPATAKKINYCG